MRAICIKEPYASQIRAGRKRVEYRSWRTKHRGELLIVASRRPKAPLSGKAVCIVEVVDCRPLRGGGYGWKLREPRPVTAFEVKGRLGLFDVQVPAGQ